MNPFQRCGRKIVKTHARKNVRRDDFVWCAPRHHEKRCDPRCRKDTHGAAAPMTASHLAELVPKQRKQPREPGSRCFDTMQDPHQLVPIATYESMETPCKVQASYFKTSPYAKDWGLHRQKRKTYGVWAAII